MRLTVKDAATRLGCSPRAVRAGLKAGRIKGYKRGGRWVVPRRNLPMTEAQSRATELTIDDLHDAVDEAVPAHIKAQLGASGVASLRAFEHTRQVLAAVDTEQGAVELDPLRGGLREALRAIAEGHHQ